MMNTSLPVLIVDDSSTMIHIIADLVRKIGFTDVDTERDGPSALQRLRQKNTALSYRIGKWSR